MVNAWEALVPSVNHVPTPLPVFRALVALALLWGWPIIAIIISLSFLGLLRPGEALALKWCDLLLPSQLMQPGRMYVRIRKPKSRKVAARQQHVRIDEPSLISLLESFAIFEQPAASIWQGTRAQFVACHNALVSKLGIGICDGSGLTPASHRGGGATWLFEESGSLDTVRWRGRWRQERTLEIYVQEVGALSVLPALSPSERDLIRALGEAAGPIIATVAAAPRR